MKRYTQDKVFSSSSSPWSLKTMVVPFLQFLLLFLIASESNNRVGVVHVHAFSPMLSTSSCTSIGVRKTYLCNNRHQFRDSRQQQQQQQQQRQDLQLFSTPPPLSPLSDNDDYDYDDYTPAEVTKMQDVILSLSVESNDEARRARLQQIMEVALAGPDGGPKRFTVLFDRVLTQVGEQVQREARENYSKRAAASTDDDDNETEESTLSEEKEEEVDEGTDENPEEKKPVEKTPEELKLWALVDMMIQSKTLIKNQKI